MLAWGPSSDPECSEYAVDPMLELDRNPQARILIGMGSEREGTAPKDLSRALGRRTDRLMKLRRRQLEAGQGGIVDLSTHESSKKPVCFAR